MFYRNFKKKPPFTSPLLVKVSLKCLALFSNKKAWNNQKTSWKIWNWDFFHFPLVNTILFFWQAIAASEVLELNEERVRGKDNPLQWVIKDDEPKGMTIEGLPSHPVPASQPPVIVSLSPQSTASDDFLSSRGWWAHRVDGVPKSGEDIGEDGMKKTALDGEEVVDEKKVQESEMWRFVDAPVFVPRKTTKSSPSSENEANNDRK